MDLYREEGLKDLELERKKYLILFISFQALAWISFLLGLLLSNYYTQLVYKIVISILFTIFFIISSLFFSKFYYLKKLTHEYQILLSSDGKMTVKVIIEQVINDIITLPDGSRVKEVICSIKDEKRRFLLSEIFDEELPLNKPVFIQIKFDYIVGFKDEK